MHTNTFTFVVVGLTTFAGCENDNSASEAAKIVKVVESLGGTADTYAGSQVKKRGLPKNLTGTVSGIMLDRIDLRNVDMQPLLPKTLRSVSLRGAIISDAQITSLQDCERLQWLILDSATITDKALRAIEGKSSLAILELSRCDITDEGLKSLEECHSLEEVRLLDTRVTKKGIERLQSRLPRTDVLWSTAPSEEVRNALVELDRHGARVDSRPQHVREKLGLPGHYSITFDNHWKEAAGDDCQRWLQTITNSEQTSINILAQVPEAMSAVGSLTKLHGLKIGDKANCTDEDVKGWTNGVKVSCLSLDCPLLTDRGFERIPSITGLTELILGRMPLTKTRVGHLIRLDALSTLTINGLRGGVFDPPERRFVEFSDETFKELRRIPALKRISLYNCPDILPDSIQLLRSQGIEVATDQESNKRQDR